MLDERQTQHATLGCGTFILIALIVMIFGNSGTSNLERDVQSLRSDIIELKKAVDSQTNEIKRLNDKLVGAQPAEKNPAGP
jgi:hypothetical protein